MRVWLGVIFWAFLLSIACVGCSKSDPPVETATPPAAAVPATVPSTSPAANDAPTPTRATPPAVDPEKPETKWIGNIPYDVFFDQPLVVASDMTAVGGNPTPPAPTGATDPVATLPAESPTAGTDAPAPASGGKPDWGKIVTLDLAQEAVKVARTEINASLQGIPKYNAGLESIRLNAALMGMMAVVIAEHPESANWKPSAKYVRDLCYAIQGKATEKGSSAYKATQELFEQITGILDGGKPPETESQDSVPYSETADRSDMMKIIDNVMNDLKSNIGEAKRMKDQSAEITRQLAVMQAMGVMMSDTSYEYADNEEYQQFTKAFIDGAVMGIEAVKADKFDEFQSALNKMNGSCSECHPKFRGQDSGS